MYFALFLCFSIISNSNGDAIVNIFGSAALAEFGEENTKYFYTNQYIYAFNASEDYFNTYKREHCGDNSSFNVCLFGRLLLHWRQEIKNSFIVIDNRRLSNGPMEGVNSRLKCLIKNANGYSNFSRFRNRCIYTINKDVPISLYTNKAKK